MDKQRIKRIGLLIASGDYYDPYHVLNCGRRCKKKLIKKHGNIKTQLTWAQAFILQKQKKPYDPVRQRAYALVNRERDRAKRNIRKQRYRRNASRERKFLRRISHDIYKCLCKSKSGRHWESLVGYTVAELRKHLESLFRPGMTWQNYGQHGWHIDHIFPQSRLIIDGPDDPTFRFCWSLANLQPLWSDENIDKGDKII